MNIENERKLFEKWYLDFYYTRNGLTPSEDIFKKYSQDVDWIYLFDTTYRAWAVWQASANREGFVLVENKPVAYMIQNKSWVHSHGSEYFEVKLLGEMPEPEFEGDSYDTEIPLYMDQSITGEKR